MSQAAPVPGSSSVTLPTAHGGLAHAPIGHRAAAIAVVAVIAGSLVGMVESHLGHPLWFLLAGLTAAAGGTMFLTERWIGGPVRSLTRPAADLLKEQCQPTRPVSLPTDRPDELGMVARVLDQLVQHSVQQHYESRHLRRTLDDRVRLATERATRTLESLAMRDPLTGLGNRRFIDETLDSLVQSARAAGADMVCIVVDMDNFKQVNDNLGHAAGDDLLKFVAELIRAGIRHEDCAARLGGDEFVLLMPGCNDQRAREVTQRLARLFRQHCQLTCPEAGPVSLSMGIASLLEDRSASGAELLATADRRLYVAKRAGKNQVVGA